MNLAILLVAGLGAIAVIALIRRHTRPRYHINVCAIGGRPMTALDQLFLERAIERFERASGWRP